MKAILKKVDDFNSASSDEALFKKNSVSRKTIETDALGNVVEIKKEIESIEPIFIEVDDDTYIKFDKQSNRSETINVGELKENKARIETRLSELNDFSDEHLLEWAKQHYPGEDGIREREGLLEELNTINVRLEEIHGD